MNFIAGLIVLVLMSLVVFGRRHVVVFLHDYVMFGFLWITSRPFRAHQRNVYEQTVWLYGLAEANKRHPVARWLTPNQCTSTDPQSGKQCTRRFHPLDDHLHVDGGGTVDESWGSDFHPYPDGLTS